MQRKRVTAMLLTMAMAVGMLAGCGQQETGKENSESSVSSENSESSVASESEEETELEEVTIQLWLAGVGKQKDSDEVWEAFNEKLQEYVPNTTVEISVFSTAEYKEKYPQMLASGEEVDLAWTAPWGTGRSQDQDTADGNILALDELLEEYGQGIIESLGEDVLDMHRYLDGNLYYIISWQGLYDGVHAFRMPSELTALAGETWVEDTQAAVTKWYSEEWTAENHQAVFDQFDKYFAALKEADKLYSGYQPGYCFSGWNLDTGLDDTIPITQSVGVQRGDDTFTVVDAVQSDQFRLVAENEADFYLKGYIRSDIASLDSSSLSFVTNGEYTPNTTVLYCHYALTESDRNKIEKAAGVDVEFIQVEENGKLAKGTNTSMVIPYCADEPERAMMVLNAIYTEPELYQLLVYGIEGKHYTDNGDGSITTSYGSTPTSDSDYGIEKWRIGTCLNALPTQDDSPNYYQEMAELEKTAYISPLINFVFETSEVADVIAALKAVDDEYSPMIKGGYTGNDWEETLDQWITERKAAGVDTLIEEYQKQLDAYIQENNITSW